jgi:putative PEP-CTERM system histidine kinase
MRLGALTEFFRSREWVVNLHEADSGRRTYDGAPLPSWVGELDDAWLIVPLLHEDSVQGFVVLSPPRARLTLNWEDLDLIKTAARQAAGYLAQYRAAKALSEARQFEGFNRLSAYVIHDLKNLIAQLSLVAKNARRHRDNPAFFEDAVTTIENAVAKMNRLMTQLRSAAAGGQAVLVDLRRVLREVVDERSDQRPVPSLDDGGGEVWVEAEVDRLVSVLGNVVQNAQDATPADGRVEVRLRGLPGQAIVEVRDTGVGMDEEFVRERLFQPFYSTKGLTGMGVGAYECRDFVQAAGGTVDVTSTPGTGTTFTVVLPRAEATAEQPDDRSASEGLRA